MNQFYLESRSKEKVNEIMNEGMRSQAYERSRSRRSGFVSRIPKLILLVLGILWILQMIVR